ncbi:MAG: hypothetical protein CM15mP103_04050 [Gammaproteobacteria bacterium]|nr:MAG: hypothetical protein CM15mP103_04050 [Gammaproteobacteria bacterium]
MMPPDPRPGAGPCLAGGGFTRVRWSVEMANQYPNGKGFLLLVDSVFSFRYGGSERVSPEPRNIRTRDPSRVFFQVVVADRPTIASKGARCFFGFRGCG